MLIRDLFGIILCVVLLAESACSGCSDKNDALHNTFSFLNGDGLVKPERKASEKRNKFNDGLVYVTKVVDGDTFWVDDGKSKVKVRFIGIDAPETRNAGRKKKGYFGKESLAYVKVLTENQWVRLETDVQKRDRYRRLLAYVYLEDGTFLNEHLVKNGYASVDTHPPNIKFVDILIVAQKEARAKGKGIWINTR